MAGEVNLLLPAGAEPRTSAQAVESKGSDAAATEFARVVDAERDAAKSPIGNPHPDQILPTQSISATIDTPDETIGAEPILIGSDEGPTFDRPRASAPASPSIGDHARTGAAIDGAQQIEQPSVIGPQTFNPTTILESFPAPGNPAPAQLAQVGGRQLGAAQLGPSAAAGPKAPTSSKQILDGLSPPPQPANALRSPPPATSPSLHSEGQPPALEGPVEKIQQTTVANAIIVPVAKGVPAGALDTGRDAPSVVSGPLAPESSSHTIPVSLSVAPAAAPDFIVDQSAVARGGQKPELAIASATTRHDGVLELRLDPPDLGAVSIRFFEDDAGVQRASVSAHNQETLDLLRRNADILHRELARHGAGEFLLDFSQRRESDGPFGAQQKRRFLRLGETPESMVSEISIRPAKAFDGAVDRFA